MRKTLSYVSVSSIVPLCGIPSVDGTRYKRHRKKVQYHN